MLLKTVFTSMAQNRILNKLAQKYGFKLGAQTVVAGTNISEMIESVKALNTLGISATIDNLGEFVFEKSEALAAKNQILDVLDVIYEQGADAHISLKPTQLGLDIDYDFCLENIREIVTKAQEYSIFINMDMEDYAHLHTSFDMFDTLAHDYDNIGTVIQSYLYEAMDLTKRHADKRLRIVKGAYQESSDVAWQDKADIDENFKRLAEQHLLNGTFTSIGTHDHHIINHIKAFVDEHNISNDRFEFQMLYGFRNDMQSQLAQEGYHFCTYVPFGKDWYGYFMRRLAERPQNLNLVTKQVFNKRTNTAIAVGVGAFILGRLSRRKSK